LGGKGFQPLAVAFNDNAGMLITSFVQNFHPSFPVGSASRQTVLDYLQIEDTPGWVVPQMVLIDRKGMIVAQSARPGSEELQSEDSLRKKITDLLGGAKKSGH
jgi:hypothetical protein